MKKGILFLMVIGISFSCNKDDSDTELLGHWILVRMTGSMSNSETTGSEMEWQEGYQININNTFQKSRNRDGVVTNISGTYNLINSSNGKLIEFVFDSESEIIGSCHPNLKEIMSFPSGNTFSSTWHACDGPGLIYKKAD